MHDRTACDAKSVARSVGRYSFGADGSHVMLGSAFECLAASVQVTLWLAPHAGTHKRAKAKREECAEELRKQRMK